MIRYYSRYGIDSNFIAMQSLSQIKHSLQTSARVGQLIFHINTNNTLGLLQIGLLTPRVVVHQQH